MIVTLEELKAHLNIITETDDVLLADKLVTAQAAVSNFMGVDAETGILDGNGDPYVPAPVKEAVLQFAAHLYEYREPLALDDKAPSAPLGVFDLIGPYKVWSF